MARGVNLSGLTATQIADYRTIMYATDLYILKVFPNAVDSNGRVSEEASAFRDDLGAKYVDAIRSGATLASSIDDKGGESFTRFLPTFLESADKSQYDEAQALDDRFMSMLSHINSMRDDYSATDFVPIPPLSAVASANEKGHISYGPSAGRVCAMHVHGFDVDPDFPDRDVYYESNQFEPANNNNSYMFIMSSNAGADFRIHNYSDANVEPLITNKVICRVRDYLKEYGESEDIMFRVSDAQKLRQAISFDPIHDNIEDYYDSLFNTETPEGEAVAGKLESWLREHRLYPSNPEVSITEFFDPSNENSNMNFYSIMDEYETLVTDGRIIPTMSRFGERGNGLSVVDVFGTVPQTDLHGQLTTRPAVTLDSVHAFLNKNQDAQTDLYEAFNGELSDEDRIQTFSISADDYLIKDGSNRLYHVRNGQVINPVTGEQAMDDNYSSLGEYISINDKLGISNLRPYIRTSDYNSIKLEIPSEFETATPGSALLNRQLQAIENAKTILDVLNERGIPYTISMDREPWQIKAKLTDSGMDVRIVDLKSPEYVGRVYQDNMNTHIVMDAQNFISGKIPENRNVPNFYDFGKKHPKTGDPYLSFMPMPNDVRNAFLYRLGENVQADNGYGEGDNLIGYNKPASRNNHPITSIRDKEDLNGNKVKDSKGNNAREYAAINTSYRLPFKTRSKPTMHMAVIGSVPVRSTVMKLGKPVVQTYDRAIMAANQVGEVNQNAAMQIYSPEESVTRILDAMGEARDNFKTAVFGQMEAELAKHVPQYRKTEWVSYRRTPRNADERNYPRDDEGRLINPATGELIATVHHRNAELLQNAGGSAGDLGNVSESFDPTVRTLQRVYLDYLENEDGVLIGLVNGKIVEESVEEFKDYVANERELADVDDPAINQLFEALNLNEPKYSQDEKLSHVAEHYMSMTDKLFGEQAEDGTLKLNVANIIKYGTIEESDLIRLIQTVKSSGINVDFVNENDENADFTYNRLKERTVVFNPETAHSLIRMTPDGPLADESLSPFMQRITDTIIDSMETTGCDVKEILIDDHGIVRYSVERNASQFADKQTTEKVEGVIGQIFEPDERGVILTKFAYENGFDEYGNPVGENYNKAIIPGYKAQIQPGDGSLESRTILRGYEQVMHEQLRANLRYQLLRIGGTTQDGAVIDPCDTLDVTKLNSVYRHLSDRKFSLDYMSELRSKGLTEEEIDAYIDTFKGAVRYDSYLKNESTINAHLSAKADDFVDDINMDGYSLTKRDITCLQDSEPGYFDPVATSTGTTQGLTRYLVRGTSVDPISGKITPTEDENAKCPLMEMEINRYGGDNPFDRQQMVFSNIVQALQFDKGAVVAHTTLQGFNMDDAFPITSEFAQKHIIPALNVEEVKAVDASVYDMAIADTENNLAVSTHDKNGNHIINMMGSIYPVEDNYVRFSVEQSDDEGNVVYGDDGEPLIHEFHVHRSDFVSQWQGNRHIVSDPEAWTYGMQVKEQMIANMEDAKNNNREPIGYRPLTVGDKLCDMNGNKGVISLVVDRNMPAELAEKQKLTDIVNFLKANPDVEIIGAPFTAPSRFNGGTTRGMMENASELNMPDGTIIQGGKGTIPIIITDKTAGEKTHLYGVRDVENDGVSDDENIFDSDDDTHSNTGRKASSQLAWGLMAKDADALLNRFYRDNASNVRSIREKMIAIGCDMDENYNMTIGYTPHHLPNGKLEERNHITIESISEGDYAAAIPTVSASNNMVTVRPNTQELNRIVDETMQKLALTGGFLELPFPITMNEDPHVETEFDEKSGKYLLPVLPVEYRTEQTYDDGSSTMHKYTRFYRGIVRAAVEYDFQNAVVERFNELDTSGFTPKQMNSYTKNKKDNKDKISNLVNRAASEYGNLKDEIVRTTFEGKKNSWKSRVMTHRLPNSATAIITPDPRIGIEEIKMSADFAKSMNLRDGDPFILWRDPLLRAEGIACMKVTIQDADEKPQLTGIAMNPASDKRFDGDFDGDTFAVISLNSCSLKERAFADEWKDASEIEQQALLSKYGIKKRAVDDIMNRYKDDELVRADAYRAFGVANTLADLGSTPDNPESKNDIVLALNMGLDVASGLAVMNDKERAEVDKLMDSIKENVYKSMTGKPECGEKAVELTNQYMQNAFKKALCSDTIKYDSLQSYFDSLNTVIVDHEAKGKIGKMEDVAAYLNVSQEKSPEYLKAHPEARFDNLVYVWGEDKDGKPARLRVDTTASFKDYGVCAMENDGTQPYFIEKNGVRKMMEPTQAFAEECEARRNDMIRRYCNVELATSIKAYGTGNAGTYSQRGVKGLRDLCILDAIEVTYGATQGLLQAKHDAVEAEQKYTILRETLPALWKGNQIQNVNGKWIPVKDENGRPVKADRDIWAEQYYKICTDKNGLDFKIHPDRIGRIADALYHTGEFSNLMTAAEAGDKRHVNDIKTNVYKNDVGATLDRLAYGGDVNVLYECCKEGRNLFDSEQNAKFRPQGSLVSMPREVKGSKAIEDSVKSYSQSKYEASKASKKPVKTLETEIETIVPETPVKKERVQSKSEKEVMEKAATANRRANQAQSSTQFE